MAKQTEIHVVVHLPDLRGVPIDPALIRQHARTIMLDVGTLCWEALRFAHLVAPA